MFTSIIFDVDGTILDTEHAILKSLQKVLKEELKREYALQDLRFALGIPGKETLRRLNVANVDEIHPKWSKSVLDFSHEVSVFEELEDVIKKLSINNLKLSIVTSKTRQELIEEFDPFGLSAYFEHTICACDTEKHKPHPEPLLTCLKRLDVPNNEAIYIGDSIYDMQCAKSAGVKFALALWGSKTSKGFEEADYVLKRPSDILDLI
ncbi:HAD family hydrolase [Bacillus cereus ATCC 10876]|uniref:HAD family hydrolase n=1 Tax=Bacillus TaxID=1386 RepID=UPI00019FFAE3|nr:MULTISPECIES: HAD family hydrolase [Bacillus]MDJ0281860.1 HAD family hydrolase [Bacillus bombysepticus]EEK48424.1 Phosphatase [Bacillus cereus ATCC 10876]KFL63654.1 HAD hydrolase, IA, variant 1 family protein [Bacillus cereus ATCC 10876]MBO1129448.1 HAD family hydrolase [Bacillus cereus]MDJ0295865.1 HAD family hydrolase [Bacillus bombysepticus]